MEPFGIERKRYQRYVRCRAKTPAGVVRALARVLGYKRMPKRFRATALQPTFSDSGHIIYFWEITLRGKLWLVAKLQDWLVVEPLGDNSPEDGGGSEQLAPAA